MFPWILISVETAAVLLGIGAYLMRAWLMRAHLPSTGRHHRRERQAAQGRPVGHPRPRITQAAAAGRQAPLPMLAARIRQERDVTQVVVEVNGTQPPPAPIGDLERARRTASVRHETGSDGR